MNRTSTTFNCRHIDVYVSTGTSHRSCCASVLVHDLIECSVVLWPPFCAISHGQLFAGVCDQEQATYHFEACSDTMSSLSIQCAPQGLVYEFQCQRLCSCALVCRPNLFPCAVHSPPVTMHAYCVRALAPHHSCTCMFGTAGVVWTSA